MTSLTHAMNPGEYTVSNLPLLVAPTNDNAECAAISSVTIVICFSFRNMAYRIY